MTDQDHVGDLLDRYRTGELAEAERLRVEQHVEACAGCRTELEELVRFARVVERGYSAGQAAAREPDWARLRSGIVERTHGRARRGGRFARYVPHAALAVLAFVALGVLWEQGIRGPGEAERALRSERSPATPDASPKPTFSRDDRAAAPGDLPPPGAGVGEAPAARGAGRQEEREEQRQDGMLDETGLRDNADAAGMEANVEAEAADRVAAAPAEHARVREEAAAPGEGAGQDLDRLGKVTAAQPPELERFQTTARNALSEADTLMAARALAQWRDSLAQRRDLSPDLERAARALADSLVAFLTSRP